MAIKSYFSNQTGAPVLNGTVGSLIDVLDACLVNGYNQVNVSSMTRSGSTVTVSCVTPHGYDNPTTTYWARNGVGNVCAISGADQPEYNGEWPISYVSDYIFTFDIGAATPATPATGTIITNRAGGGFTKVFSGTNRGVYRSNDPTSRRHFWQVNDIADCPNGQGARYAGWRGYEYMTGLDSGDGPFPTLVSSAGLFGIYVCKSDALDATSRHWALYTDGKLVIMAIHPNVAGNSLVVSPFSYVAGFGDLLSPVPDPYATICGGLINSSTAWNTLAVSGFHAASGGTSPHPNTGIGWNALARTFTGAKKPVFSTAMLGMGLPQYSSFGAYSYFMFPDGASNRYPLAPVMVYEPTSLNAVLRGQLPLYEGGCGVVHANREVITNVVGREGRVFQYLNAGASHNSWYGGTYIDLTGNEQGKWS